jgi:hypothetical protein
MPCPNQLLPARGPKIAGPHDDRAHAVRRRRLQPPLHLDADRALARHRPLRRVLVQQRKRVRTEVVDRTGQHDRRLLARGRPDRVVEHRQHLRRPVPVTGRVHRVYEHAAAACRTKHRVAVERVAAHPSDAVALHARGVETAAQRAHLPAGIAQLPRDLAADSAARAKHEYLPLCPRCACRHDRPP